MTRSEFEQRLAQLRQRIAELPSPQREVLEALAIETLERHEQIRRASLEGHRAVERLELACEQLGEACRRLARLAAEARDAVERAHGARRPAPGLN